jgi:hypothetical protein
MRPCHLRGAGRGVAPGKTGRILRLGVPGGRVNHTDGRSSQPKRATATSTGGECNVSLLQELPAVLVVPVPVTVIMGILKVRSLGRPAGPGGQPAGSSSMHHVTSNCNRLGRLLSIGSCSCRRAFLGEAGGRGLASCVLLPLAWLCISSVQNFKLHPRFLKAQVKKKQESIFTPS